MKITYQNHTGSYHAMHKQTGASAYGKTRSEALQRCAARVRVIRLRDKHHRRARGWEA